MGIVEEFKRLLPECHRKVRTAELNFHTRTRYINNHFGYDDPSNLDNSTSPANSGNNTPTAFYPRVTIEQLEAMWLEHCLRTQNLDLSDEPIEAPDREEFIQLLLAHIPPRRSTETIAGQYQHTLVRVLDRLISALNHVIFLEWILKTNLQRLGIHLLRLHEHLKSPNFVRGLKLTEEYAQPDDPTEPRVDILEGTFRPPALQWYVDRGLTREEAKIVVASFTTGVNELKYSIAELGIPINRQTVITEYFRKV